MPIVTNRPLNSSMQWIWFHLGVKPKTIACFQVNFDWQRDRTTNLFLKAKQNRIYEPKGRLTSSGHACCCCSLASRSQEKTPASARITSTSVSSPPDGWWACLWWRTTDSSCVSLWGGDLKRERRKQHRISTTNRKICFSSRFKVTQ